MGGRDDRDNDAESNGVSEMTDPYHIEADTLTTVDRYPGSPTYGQKVLEFVALWDEPGRNIYDAKNLTGALAPGTSVTIKEYCVIGSALWARIEAEQGGRKQTGWCSVVFLEQVGNLYLEAMAEIK